MGQRFSKRQLCLTWYYHSCCQISSWVQRSLQAEMLLGVLLPSPANIQMSLLLSMLNSGWIICGYILTGKLRGQRLGVMSSLSSACLLGCQQTQLSELAQATFIPITEIYSKPVPHRMKQDFIRLCELLWVRALLLPVLLSSSEFLTCSRLQPHMDRVLEEPGSLWGKRLNVRITDLGLAWKQTPTEPTEICRFFTPCLFEFSETEIKHVNVQNPEDGLQNSAGV